jgi:hypothetical protein
MTGKYLFVTVLTLLGFVCGLLLGIQFAGMDWRGPHDSAVGLCPGCFMERAVNAGADKFFWLMFGIIGGLVGYFLSSVGADLANKPPKK